MFIERILQVLIKVYLLYDKYEFGLFSCLKISQFFKPSTAHFNLISVFSNKHNLQNKAS